MPSADQLTAFMIFLTQNDRNDELVEFTNNLLGREAYGPSVINNMIYLRELMDKPIDNADKQMASYIEKFSDLIVNVHIEDMVVGVHDHLMFGEGQIHFPPVIESLASIGYSGGIHVELSRHSHDACNAAQRSYQFLKPIIEDAMSS